MKKFEEESTKKCLSLAGSGEIVLVDCRSATFCEKDRNVFLLNTSGEVVWQIEPSVMSHGVTGYSDIYFGPNHELMAYSSNGVEYEIEKTSGRILSKDLIR